MATNDELLASVGNYEFTSMAPSELNRFFGHLAGPYTLTVRRWLTPELDALRVAAFPLANRHDSNRDVFDERAWHLVISHKHPGEVAAYSRLIPGPDGYFQHLTGQGSFAQGGDSADWSRLVVSPGHRGRGLAEMMGLATLLLARAAVAT